VTTSLQIGLGGIVALLGPYGDVLAVSGWLVYQLYWPFHETKLQTWFGSIQSRLVAIETVQIALASVISTIDEDEVRDIHDRDTLDPEDVVEKDTNVTVVEEDELDHG